MKLAGSVLLVLAGLIWGLGRTRELSQRVAYLSQLEVLIQWLGAGIAYSARPLAELIRAGDGPFCKGAVRQPDFSLDPCGALYRAGAGLLRNDKDRELMRDFTAGLGASGAQGQQDHLELCAARTRQLLSEARGEYKERSRLYPGLGALLGLGAWVLLI